MPLAQFLIAGKSPFQRNGGLSLRYLLASRPKLQQIRMKKNRRELIECRNDGYENWRGLRQTWRALKLK